MHKIKGGQNENLFPRTEVKKKNNSEKKPHNKKKDKKQQEEPGSDHINFDQFENVELLVAKVVEAEKVKKSDRLLKLSLEAPEPRTIVSGIAESYRPEELVGKNVIIVANLKPVKLMGIASEGMVLTAEAEDEQGGKRVNLLTVPGEVKPGTRVA